MQQNKTDMTVEAGNKLIAEFMECKVMDFTWKTHTTLVFCEDDGSIDFRYMEYYTPDTDWNRLMQAVKKAKTICHENGFELSNNSGNQVGLPDKDNNPAHWCRWSVHDIKLSVDINSVWQQLVNFLLWYNSINNPK